MSIQIWWRERLVEKNPLGHESLRIPRINLRGHSGPNIDPGWPRAVARSALYTDYKLWFDQIFLAPYRETPYYQQNESRLPAPVPEVVFFSTMTPWLYIVGKKEQVRTYMVPFNRRHKDGFIMGKKNTYFVRLCGWVYHVAAFEQNTGTEIGVNSPYLSQGRDALIQEAREAFLAKVEVNRKRLDQSMSMGEGD